MEESSRASAPSLPLPLPLALPTNPPQDLYVPDIKTIIAANLLAPGAVVAADNTLFPGAPEYLEFIRSSPLFDSVQFKSHIEYGTVVDAIEVSTLKPQA